MLLLSRALETMKDAIETRIPVLSGKVCAYQASVPKIDRKPSVALIAANSRYYPDQANGWARLSDAEAVFCLGRYETTVQIRLWARDKYQRVELEELLLQRLFYADLTRPGVALFTISDYYGAVAAWCLENNGWQDELAFDDEWGAMLTCELCLPVLTRQPDASIQEVEMVYTSDILSTYADIDASSIEATSIDDTFGE